MHEDEVLFTEFFNQKLKERGYTLKHLSQETGIALKHLESFAHGRFEKLPSAPYVHGYFIKLGPLLGFDPDEWWARVKDQDAVHKSGSRDRMPGNRFGRGRGRMIVWGAAIVLLALIYVGARFTTIIGQPQLTVTDPSASQNRVFQSTITFRGTVRNGDSLTIDGANVPLNKDGSFSADVQLDPDRMNVVELRAKKILGRETVLTRQIYYDASQTIIPVP